MAYDLTGTSTRIQLADFMDEVLSGAKQRAAWSRLLATHYRDKAMEETRREFVLLVSLRADGEVARLTEPERDHLHSLTLGLRKEILLAPV